jgi:hypothetical protein
MTKFCTSWALFSQSMKLLCVIETDTQKYLTFHRSDLHFYGETTNPLPPKPSLTKQNKKNCETVDKHSNQNKGIFKFTLWQYVKFFCIWFIKCATFPYTQAVKFSVYPVFVIHVPYDLDSGDTTGTYTESLCDTAQYYRFHIQVTHLQTKQVLPLMRFLGKRPSKFTDGEDNWHFLE